MSADTSAFPKVLTLYLQLCQYPILSSRIRERMRQELFDRGVISHEAFEREVKEKAIQSQIREGLQDSLGKEPDDLWAQRRSIIRDHLTDFYFAYNLPHDLFEDLVRRILADRVPDQDVILTFHPELAPWDMLFAQGEAYEALPPAERLKVEHHLQEIKVVLIKSMVSDHLEYVGIAKEWFDIADLKMVRERRFGRGKIGGKAAGLMLAELVLRKSADAQLLKHISVPRSWFVGADVFYQFTQYNEFLDFANQKYRSEEEICSEYPSIVEAFARGLFPEEVVDGLRTILEQVGSSPLIVRSSSLLEDSFGTSFAGKYESCFCPNQHQSAKENLRQLIGAISRVYASVYSPEVLLYRRRMGLIDYDERMAVLIQEVQGGQKGRYFMPFAAGVAFSRNQFRWSTRIDRMAGFMRLVWGLGTRAVEQLDDDYPRLVALSHPLLRPDNDPEYVHAYSQHYVDLIDLEGNVFRTLPVSEVINSHSPDLELLAQRYHDGDLRDYFGRAIDFDPKEAVLTFDGLLHRTPLARYMRQMLQVLESGYKVPVDTEFTLSVERDASGDPVPRIYLLQCRPLSGLDREAAKLPQDVPADRRLFVTRRNVPDGRVSGVRYVVYIAPEGYYSLQGPAERRGVVQVVRRLNKRLEGQAFILMGPGRWGSNSPELGIPVTYADIHHARALIELSVDRYTSDPSYGTHFFQDLVESRIYPLALNPNDPGAEMRLELLTQAENQLAQLLPEEESWSSIVRVVDIPAATAGAFLELVMDGDAGTAMAYFSQPEVQAPEA